MVDFKMGSDTSILAGQMKEFLSKNEQIAQKFY